MTIPSDPFSHDPNQPPGGYGAPPPGYGQPPGFGAPPPGMGGPQLAGWPDRALSGLIDWFGPALVASLIRVGSPGLGLLLSLAALGWTLYNAYLGGSTGQSYGKKIAGTRLVREQDGQLIGGGTGIGRAFVHILDGLPCYLGFLWPLWDAKRQTFADKIMKTLVIKV